MIIDFPEFKAAGTTPLQQYENLIGWEEYVTEKLCRGHDPHNIEDSVGIFFNLSSKFLEIGRSFQVIAKRGIDSISCYCLFRTQADYLSTLYLIFNAPTEEETKFRYLLYFLDGFVKRKEILSIELKKNNNITQKEYSALKNQMSSAVKNAQTGIIQCTKTLENHPYRSLNSNLFKKIVDKTQWKYKTFSKDTTKLESYKWEDLYHLLDSRESVSSFFSYLSQYVHGLSVTILINKEDFNEDSLYCFGINLLAKYEELLKKLYGKDTIDGLLKVGIKKQVTNFLQNQKQ